MEELFLKQAVSLVELCDAPGVWGRAYLGMLLLLMSISQTRRGVLGSGYVHLTGLGSSQELRGKKTNQKSKLCPVSCFIVLPRNYHILPN